jgi:uncharacterized protein (TIGR02145 family)
MKRKILTNFAGLTLLLLALFTACDNRENDFYFVGPQPVNLMSPKNDSVTTLDYTNPEKIITFKWQSKRPYMDVSIKFSLDSEFPVAGTEVRSPGVAINYSIAAVRLDSILAALNVPVGGAVPLYWTIEVKNPEFGWCDEVRSMSITRFDIPDNVIILTSPSNHATINLDRTQPATVCNFTWESRAGINNYHFALSFAEDFSHADETIERDMGSAKVFPFTHFSLDSLLEARGLDRGEAIDLYWKVTAAGDNLNPVVNSETHKVKVKRFAHEPYSVEITSPVEDSEIILETGSATENLTFAWNCEATGITYSLKIYDTELGAEKVYAAISEKTFNITQQNFDRLLEQNFEMVPSQRKKLYMVVTPSDLNEANVSATVPFWAKRLPAGGGAPVALVNAPANGTAWTLDYAATSAELFNVTWDFAGSATFAVEYSLNANMSASVKKTLDANKSVSMTHRFLDDMLSDLGGAYLTKDVYWRITSDVLGLATPSETRKLTLTGMLKPLVDIRDGVTETYPVVKIGNDFWMGENLRATKYADGATLPVTAQDVIPNSTTLASYPKFNDAEYKRLTGKYYTWAVATRLTWQQAKTATQANQKVQGVCPDGWHLPSVTEIHTMRTSSEVGQWSAEKIKHPTYWATTDGTNSTGFGLVYTSYFYHQQMSAVQTDNIGLLWTSSPSIAGSAGGWNGYPLSEDSPGYAAAFMLENGAGDIMFRGAPVQELGAELGANWTVPCRCIRDK